MYVARLLFAAPTEKMAEVINRTRREAKARIAKVSVLPTTIAFMKIHISPTLIIIVVL